jgi:glutamine phosphoribosylpyrophosphate amidotransferase
MCWMTIQNDDSGAAVEQAVDRLRHGERCSGGDSWGLAFPKQNGEGLEIRTGVGTVPQNMETVASHWDADVALGHTRWATRGEISMRNAHPFAIRNSDGDTIAALAHNGTWHDAPKTDRADSFYIARLAESMILAGHDLNDAVQHAGDVTGETLVVIDSEGTGYVYSGRFEITDTGGDVASSGGMPIPTGELRVI